MNHASRVPKPWHPRCKDETPFELQLSRSPDRSPGPWTSAAAPAGKPWHSPLRAGRPQQGPSARLKRRKLNPLLVQAGSVPTTFRNCWLKPKRHDKLLPQILAVQTVQLLQSVGDGAGPRPPGPGPTLPTGRAPGEVFRVLQPRKDARERAQTPGKQAREKERVKRRSTSSFSFARKGATPRVQPSPPQNEGRGCAEARRLLALDR